MSVKCQTSPIDEDSTAYKLIISIFKSGNSKEWLEWIKNVEHAAVRQNATTGPAKYALAKCLLEDGVLQAFEKVTRTAGAGKHRITRQ